MTKGVCFHLKIKKFNIQVTPIKKDTLVVILWATVISSIMIKAHMLLYQDPLFSSGSPFVIYRPPSLTIPDMLILTAISMIVTIILSDVKPIIYGFVVSLVLSFIIAVTYVSLFIWYVLGWGDCFSQSAYGWEWALYLGFLNVFYVMVPWVIGTSVVGLVIGVVVRGWIKTS